MPVPSAHPASGVGALEAGGHIASLAALEGQQHQGEGEEEGLHAGNGCSEQTDTDAPILMAL